MTTLDELLEPMTVDEARDAIYAALAVRGVTTTGWKPGAVVRTIIAALAIVLAGLSTIQSLVARSGFLDFAEGDWLKLLARYLYGVEPYSGAFATGTILATNATGAIYVLAAGDLVVSNSTTGKTYRNVDPITIGSLAVDVPIVVSAEEIGSDSTSYAGEIDSLVTTLNGVAVTNPAAVIGEDEWSDEEIRINCRLRWSILGTGSTETAYEYKARAASPEVRRVRVLSHNDLGTDRDGWVTIVLAGTSGGVSATAVTAVSDAIAAERQLCDGVRVVSARGLPFSVTGTLYVRAGLGAAAKDEAEANIAALANTATIGATVYLDELIERAMTPEGVIRRTFTIPTSDIPLAYDEVPQPTASFTVVEVA